MLEIIRRTKCVNDIPLQTHLAKLVELQNSETQYSVHELCEAMEVAHSTFYNHLFRKTDRSEFLKKYAELKQQVQQVYDDSKQRYGAEKIRAILKANGIEASKERIQGIMRELVAFSNFLRTNLGV